MFPGVVRSEDAKQLFLLAGECREASDRSARRRHFLSRMAEIARARVGIEGTMAYRGLDAPPGIREVSDIGWATSGERARIYDWIASSPLGSDPLSRAVVSGLAVQPVVTAQRRDAMSAQDWQRAELRNELHRPADIDPERPESAPVERGIGLQDERRRSHQRPERGKQQASISTPDGEIEEHRQPPVEGDELEQKVEPHPRPHSRRAWTLKTPAAAAGPSA
jgi:hypothetical protein